LSKCVVPRLAAVLALCMAGIDALPAAAADLVWEVESPFRFYKPTSSFALHEAAYKSIRGDVTRRRRPTYSRAWSAA